MQMLRPKRESRGHIQLYKNNFLSKFLLGKNHSLSRTNEGKETDRVGWVVCLSEDVVVGKAEISSSG